MNTREQPNFELPKKLEKIFAGLCNYFGQKDRPLLQQILVNSRYRVDEGVDYDNWNGGTWGHTIIFELPSALYFQVMDELHEVADALKDGINRLGNISDEYISSVELEVQEDSHIANWREQSGFQLQKSPLRVPTSDGDLQSLWTPGFLRVFLTHKSQFKVETADLKDRLRPYCVACFVAHEDIEPSKEWQVEIEKALFSMHALVPILSPGFHDSNWTDQEVGIAIGRGIPVIPVKLGTDPYGFIGKYQALPGHSKTTPELAEQLFALLIKQPSIADVAIESLIAGFEQSDSFSRSKFLIDVLDKHLTFASSSTIQRLKSAEKNNSQVREAFAVQKKLPSLIRRLTGEE
jgi:hypothetical protein